MRRLSLGAFALSALLAGCGDLPQPFLGRPGARAELLSRPPPSRLDVPRPATALLTDDSAAAWSGAVASALAAQELPAEAVDQVRKGDWSLQLAAELKDGRVVPTYTVLDPGGKAMGSVTGDGVAAEAWSSGQAAPLQAAASAAAPKLVALMTGIRAREEMSDPHSLLNRPPVVWLKPVTGAPGDGNVSLTRQMTQRLPQQGDIMQDGAKGADFVVAGQVATAQGAKGTERIEIQWIVTDATGNERGRVVQLNEVPPGSLDLYWGDVAVAVADEAAGGVQVVILRASGRVATPATAAAGSKPGE